MGNNPSTPSSNAGDQQNKYKSFPGSAILEKAICGSIDTTDPSEYQDSGTFQLLMRRAEVLCVSSPMSAATDEHVTHYFDEGDEENSIRESSSANPSAKLLAKALVSEVNDTSGMNQKDMEKREKKLLKAQKAAKDGIGKPVGAAGPPHMLRSVALACTGDDMPLCNADDDDQTLDEGDEEEEIPASPFQVTLGISLSRRHSCGHASTITRQTVYDFNELQDRQYKYVSATDSTGWRAGGGEPGGDGEHSKMASPDSVHIPIIRIDCPNNEAVDSVISALASGEIFIPHMSILPESLSVNGVSPPDLVVKFGCERNDDLPPDEWPNWTLEFMHNQLYDFFYSIGARWTKRSFSITLAQKVRWKTVKHMNRYFANAEKVMEAWREKGPQYLDPVVSHLEGGASKEEVVRPHGIYLFRNGKPTNYFPPNFDPPYTTKMTRSLLLTVLDKSWDKKRRDWTSKPVPRVVDAAELMVVACGCGDGDGTVTEGFVAQQATGSPNRRKVTNNDKKRPKKKEPIVALSEVEFGDDDEEKKSEEQAAKYGTAEEDVLRAKRGKRFSIQTDDARSAARSTTNKSVAESGTTVMHANLTKKTDGVRSPLHSEGKKLFSDEDFLDGDDSPAPSPKVHTRNRNSPREALKRHHQREKKDLSKVSEGDENRSPKQSRSRKKKTGYTMEVSSPRSKGNEPSLAAPSLEYSTDGSSSMFPQDASLLGQQFTGVDPKKSSISKQPTLEEEDQMMLLSLQTSTDGSVQSIVPSDEELFAVGWAKALDANSGNYYYFTLDRSKTVWENPLSAEQCAGEQKKSSIDP